MPERRLCATLLLLLLVACAPSGNDTADQATSAQRFLPELEGYSRSDADNLSDALVTLGGGASLLSGNPALAAGIAIHHHIFIEGFNNPLTGTQTAAWPFAVTVLLTLLWIVGMTNTVNFLDGLDGLSHGVVCIAAAVLFVNSALILEPPQLSVSLLPLALTGATLGFLINNFYPARIFAGGGAYLLGYLIACLSIIGGAKMATVLMVMALPILDAVWQVFNRVLTGRSPFRGDRGHAHHRLLDLGYSQRQIVLGYYLFCTCFGTLTLVLESRIFKLASLTLLSLSIVCGLAVLLWLGRAGAQEVAGSRSPGSGRKGTSA